MHKEKRSFLVARLRLIYFKIFFKYNLLLIGQGGVPQQIVDFFELIRPSELLGLLGGTEMIYLLVRCSAGRYIFGANGEWL